MKKIKLMSLLALFSFLIASQNVFAYNAQMDWSGGSDRHDTGIVYSELGNANKGVYRQRSYKIRYGGKLHDAYCLDPHLSAPTNLTCSPYEGDPGIIWLLEQFKGISDNDLKLLTFRFYGIYKDLSKGSTTGNNLAEKVAMIRFLQVKDGNTEVMKINPDPYSYLSGNNALIDQAFNLAHTARGMGGGELEESTTGSINVGQKQVNGLNATYPLTSNAEIKPEFIDFECENCTILNKQWSGTTGTVTVAANECDKEYKLLIVYKASNTNAYICSSGGAREQTFFMIGDGAEEEVKVPYPDKVACDGEDCCTEDPIEPGWIGGNVNNCCEDGGNSEAHEYDLDKLFCYDKDLHVDYYNPKCKTDYYVDEDADLNDKYCKMFCTERVSVEIPGPITATSGRYFQLTTTSKGTKSPYIEGFKRCRVRVQYDVWEKDYRAVVQKQISAYKDFQMKIANYKIYESAVQQPNVTGTVTAKQSCKKWIPRTCPDGYGDCGHDVYTTVSKSISYNYELWKFNILEKKYYWPRLNPTKLENYSEYLLEYNNDNATATHKQFSTWQLPEQITKVDSEANAITCPSGYSKDGSPTRDKLPHEGSGYPNEKVPDVKADWKNQADGANNVFKSAAKEAKELEKDLDKCDYYFAPGGGKLGGPYKGANAEENYNFNASMDFSYTQVYLDNDKGLQMDEQYIQFKDEPGCVITGPTAGPDGEDKLAGKRYSTDYSKTGNIEKLVDFGEKDLQYEESPTGFQKYRDEQYDADKLFTHDAKYRAECSWDEGDNIYYTLSPNGFVSEGTDFINFTEHGQEYRLHLSTLDGTYETHWKLIGLGSTDKNSGKGKFDDFFMSQGQTCANESPSETSMLTCKIHVEYEIVLTGYCNGTNGTDTTVDVADCDPYKEGYNLFTFKVVDSTNLFPNGYNTSAGEVAYNWSSTEKGQTALREIQARGAADKTYSQENLTYSFILSPTDMGHVKNYNAQANANGGYSDFNMNCNCSGDSCINCKSIFLNELANGNVTYDGQAHSVTGWGNKNTSLDGIRRKYGW